ncbi:hypothetical protein FVEN_g12743 [Fusarium venenatum]|nr:hypothetical protein FVEN_g12743 [Fusarium venenatum]
MIKRAGVESHNVYVGVAVTDGHPKCPALFAAAHSV